jgi:NADH-quinone oxidoreductase subunit L
MLLPMSILAFFSIVVGFINIPTLFSENHLFENYLAPIFERSHHLVPSHETIPNLTEEWSILLLPLLVIVSIIFFSYKRFVNESALQTASGLGRLMADKFYFDEIYDFIIVKPSIVISNFFRTIVDQSILNSFIDSVGSSTLLVGNYVRRLQSGNTGLYILLMVFSIITVLFLNIIL